MGVPSEEKYAKLDSMAEEFAERWRRGERPALQEFIDRQPDLADDIRELFPALVEMAQAEPDGPPRTPAPAAPALRQVGEYRIVREIGRGGMGVVYEAEQTSLGRRVALKILPAHIAKDGKALGRFQREARAAAKLHHTNIVPVFEVGQDGDVCYYAMQFIQGQSLDQVVEELRRLRAESAASRGRQPPEETRTKPRRQPHHSGAFGRRFGAQRGGESRRRNDDRGATGRARCSGGVRFVRVGAAAGLRRAVGTSNRSCGLTSEAPPASASKLPWPWPTPTSAASCTATLSRPTCCWTRPASSGSPTSAWPRRTTTG